MTVAMLLLAARLATAPGCDGLIVHSIDVRVDRPDFSGMTSRWRAVARSIGLHHASTQASVIRAFLALHVGQSCTERRRLESERMLRAQSFIGDAEVTAVPDSAGGVMVTVVSRDEIPVLAGARFHGIGLPETIELGSENIGGAGILGSGSLERANGYRTGVGARFVATTAFGRPYRLTAEGERARLGHSVLAAFDHPLYTDLQHVAWHAAYLDRDDYIDIERPADDGLALQLQQERWEVSGIIRAFGVRTVTVLGVGASRAHVTPSDSGVLVTDQGLQPDSGVALRNRYDSFLGTRVGPIVGLQRVRYATVSGFDALYAAQDVLSGFRLGVFGARGLGGLGEADDFISAAGYAGAASSRSLLAIATELEARRSLASSQWDGVVGSGRAAFYLKTGDDVTITISDELSMGSRSRLPVQLSIGDWRGGVRGYGGSALSGSTRNVVRTEARLARPAAIHAADVGIAAFFETGMLRAGDAPYGVSTTRSSAGISLLTAYPTRAKRMVRIDFAVPFDRTGTRANRVEVRLTMVDRTNHFWIEPGDVTRARTGGLPSAIFGWPNS